MKRQILLSSLTAIFLWGGYAEVAHRSAWAQEPSTAPQTESGWELLSRPEAGFAIEIPPGTLREEVQSVETEVGQIELHTIGVDRETRVYAVRYNDFPEVFQALPAETLLEGTMRGLTANVSQRLEADRPISLAGHPGLDLYYEGLDGLVYKHRVYLVNQRIYQTIVVTSQEDLTNFLSEADRFLDSFNLTALEPQF
ncbi:hypothetical protein IQ235_18635 [Oscillatoriales cyanobacterium LEGE 11467]|uniref:Uncharacterized protein n=1 Tax=Zarconia navalis LEGE 11467 TaxID=1828826 RepID=A0A928W407_9CYAN|nr:hypothetical protein [Zarconia navalis]MBE9042780.1 hypothetical protein [Zarconia navalis LEGE 11467]